MCSSICFSILQASAGSFRRSSHAEEGQIPVRVTLYMFLDDCRGWGWGGFKGHELLDLKENSSFNVIVFSCYCSPFKASVIWYLSVSFFFIV